MKYSDRDQLIAECTEHASVQIDLHFSAIAEEFELEFGDITPGQALRVGEIIADLAKVSADFVEQNTIEEFDEEMFEEAFAEWLLDGNVIKCMGKDGTYYSTQDTMYNNRFNNVDALKDYFNSEFYSA